MTILSSAIPVSPLASGQIKKAHQSVGPWISQTGEVKPAQGIVKSAENGEVWPVAELPEAL